MSTWALAQHVRGKSGSAYGDVEWVARNGRFHFDLPVAWDTSDELPECTLRMQHRPMRPWQPTVLILAEGTCLWRIDFNAEHQGRRDTHLQTDTDRSFIEWLPDLPSADPLDNACDIEPMFHTGANTLGVDTAAVIWLYPPKGAHQ